MNPSLTLLALVNLISFLLLIAIASPEKEWLLASVVYLLLFFPPSVAVAIAISLELTGLVFAGVALSGFSIPFYVMDLVYLSMSLLSFYKKRIVKRAVKR